MRLNAKDIAAGVFLLLVAGVGLWLNLDHSMGTARRMGPGYMPMLTFALLLGLAAFVLVLSFTNGPDPLVKWTGIETAAFAGAIAVGVLVYLLTPTLGPIFGGGYYAVGSGMLAGFLVFSIANGWRMLGLVLAAMCTFGLLLEKGGFILAVIGTVVVSALAEPEHRARPIGVLGLVIFLVALCWWVFIAELDIRVPVWPQL